MAYANLEEVWGQDYKSFLSPASLSPDWMEKCNRDNNRQESKAPSGFSTEHERRFHYSGLDEVGTPYTDRYCGGNNEVSGVEHFSGSERQGPKMLTPRNDDEDFDLMLNHNEFNVPMHFESPVAIDPGLDDYYKLVNSEVDRDTLDSYRYPYQDTNYSEEIQHGGVSTKQCHSMFPAKAKHHLKKCKHCRKQMKEWLQELGGFVGDVTSMPNNINKDIVTPTKEKVKQLFPPHLRGYIDLLFFIAIGIFLIFVLDTFVRLGKSFSKK